MKVTDDFKIALKLGGVFGLAAACTAPLLLPGLPPEARKLPVPLPVFCVLLAAQLTVIYGLLALAGLRLARGRGLVAAGWSARGMWEGVGVGLVCGTLLVVLVSMIQQLLPDTLPKTLHPPGFLAALVASIAGSLGEEILFRLFLLSLLLRLLPAGRSWTVFAIAISSLAFGVAHAPGFVLLFGGLAQVPPLAWVWLIALNGVCGATYGVVYLRYGVFAAIAAHLATDLVWHAASQLLRI